MSHPFRRACAVLLTAGLCLPAIAHAHGVIGDRFFPATITTDDPFAADELALPTVTVFNHETDIDMEYSKSIFPGVAVSVDLGYIDSDPPGGPKASGFDNIS